MNKKSPSARGFQAAVGLGGIIFGSFVTFGMRGVGIAMIIIGLIFWIMSAEDPRKRQP